MGLPLGLVLARAGSQVALIDVDEERKEAVRAGRMPFLEHGAEPLLRDTLGSTLHVVDGLDAIAESEHVVITIGTPIDEYLSPRYQPLFDLATEIAPNLRPATKSSSAAPSSRERPGSSAGTSPRSMLDVNLSYCPERIAQGYAITELDRLPQIVSGLTDEAVEGALALFRRLTDRLLTVDVEEAELAKLFLNSWRYIQFAIANQFYMIAEDRGLDFFRIYHGDDGRLRPSLRLSAAGLHCRPVPAQGHDAALGLRALALPPRARGDGGERGPGRVHRRPALRASTISRTKTVGILGMAFKREVDDTRDSLAFKLRKLLTFRGARVLASDAFVDDPSFVPVEQLVAESDIIVLGAPHEAYRDLDLSADKEVVDVWGFFEGRIPSPAEV